MANPDNNLIEDLVEGPTPEEEEQRRREEEEGGDEDDLVDKLRQGKELYDSYNLKNKAPKGAENADKLAKNAPEADKLKGMGDAEKLAGNMPKNLPPGANIPPIQGGAVGAGTGAGAGAGGAAAGAAEGAAVAAEGGVVATEAVVAGAPTGGVGAIVVLVAAGAVEVGKFAHKHRKQLMWLLAFLIFCTIFSFMIFGSLLATVWTGLFGNTPKQAAGKNNPIIQTILKFAVEKALLAESAQPTVKFASTDINNFQIQNLLAQNPTIDLQKTGVDVNNYHRLDFINARDKEYVTSGEIDARLVSALIYVIERHSHIAISHIVSAYETMPDNPESGQKASAQIIANVSAHKKGQAADISEIDQVYKVLEPKESCQNAVAAACGIFAFSCKRAAKAAQWGDIVYYQSEPPKVAATPTTNIEAKASADPNAVKANDKIQSAANKATEVTGKVQSGQNKLAEMAVKLLALKDKLTQARDKLSGALNSAPADARGVSNQQIEQINTQLSRIDTVTSQVQALHDNLDKNLSFIQTTKSRLDSLKEFIAQAATIPNINVNVTTGASAESDARLNGALQTIVDQAVSMGQDINPLNKVVETVLAQIDKIAEPLDLANNKLDTALGVFDQINSHFYEATTKLSDVLTKPLTDLYGQIPQDAIDQVDAVLNTTMPVNLSDILSLDTIFSPIQNIVDQVFGDLQSQFNLDLADKINQQIQDKIAEPASGAINGKIDIVNGKLGEVQNKVQEAKDKITDKIGQDIQDNEDIQKLNDTLNKLQGTLDKLNGVKGQLNGYLDKLSVVRQNLAILSSIAHATKTSANFFNSVPGGSIDTSGLPLDDVIARIDEANASIDNVLAKLSGFMDTLDQVTSELSAQISNIQGYINNPTGEVTTFLNSLTAQLDKIQGLDQIDIFTNFNLRIVALEALQEQLAAILDQIKQAIIDKTIGKIKEKIEKEFKDKIDGILKDKIGELADSLGIDPGLAGGIVSEIGSLFGGKNKNELLRQRCMGNIMMFTPADFKYQDHPAKIIPIKVSWQDDKPNVTYVSGEQDEAKTTDPLVFNMVYRPQARHKVRDTIDELLQFPYGQASTLNSRVTQLITFSQDRDVQPFMAQLKTLYGLPRPANLGLFSMPESWAYLHIAY